MFTYANLALMFLRLANTLASWGREAGQIKAGEDIAIGREALAIAKQTSWGKAIAEKIDAMGDDQLTGLERDLER